MRRIILVIVLMLTLPSAGCALFDKLEKTEEKKSPVERCDDYCDLAVEAHNNTIYPCWIDNVGESMDQCVAECQELIGDMNEEDQQGMVDCLDCLEDEAGSQPDNEDLDEAWWDCIDDDSCDASLTENFGEQLNWTSVVEEDC